MEELGDLSFNFTAILNTQSQEQGIASYLRQFFQRQEPLTSRRSISDIDESISQLDFSEYLDTVENELKTIRRRSTRRPRLEQSVDDTEVESFGRVPYVYYQKDFCLNFASYGVVVRMQEEQQQLNDYLDLVELNLFRQVNLRFNDFFKILKNLQFLDRAVLENIQRLQQMRQAITQLKEGYYRTAANLQRKVFLQQNKEKLMKHLIIIRSLRKLPPTINSILESSLPYECVGLLASGKQKYKMVAGLECLKGVGRTLENGDNIVKHSLYKQFSDKIFLYLTAPITPPFAKRLAEVSQLGALTNFNQSGSVSESTIIQESYYYYSGPAKGQRMPSTATQQEISRIIVESYLIVDYGSNSQLRTKLIEFVRIASKSFQDELRLQLLKVVKQRENERESIIGQLNGEDHPVEESAVTLEELCEDISLPYYGKLVLVFHEMLRNSLVRLLGCTSCLIHGFLKLKNLQHEKARALVQEFLSIAVALCKFVCEKTVAFLGLKRLNTDTSVADFTYYLAQLVYWEQSSQTMCSLQLFEQIEDPVFGEKLAEYKVKLLSTFESVRSTKKQLQELYVTNLHKFVINNELKEALQNDEWKAMDEVPPTYRSMLSFILNGDEQSERKSITKDPNSSLMGSFYADTPGAPAIVNGPHPDKIRLDRKTQKTEFKLLKSVIIIGRRQYKIIVPLLLFLEQLQEYLRVEKLYPQTHDLMMEKISELVRSYSIQSYQLIVGAGAIKFQKIKTKNITARQLCLSWNCLQFIQSILQTFNHPEIRKATDALNQHADEIFKRLATIITGRIDNQVAAISQLNLRSQVTCPTQHTTNITASYKQMLEILQQFMEIDKFRVILLPAVNLIVRKYMAYLEESGARGREEALAFLSEMGALEMGFEKELKFMREMFSKPRD